MQKYLEDLFGGVIVSSEERFIERMKKNTFLKYLNEVSRPKGKSDAVLLGDPWYVNWCIINRREFNLSEDDLQRIQSLDYKLYLGLEIEYKMEDIYSYRPIYGLNKYEFPKNILQQKLSREDKKIRFGWNEDIEKKTYRRYQGSHAQEVEGYSDKFIDDAFGGDPDAYWNID